MPENNPNMMEYTDASPVQIEAAMQQAWTAFQTYKNSSLQQRADFMRAIADELAQSATELVHIAMEETQLTEARLRSELARTQFQLTSYGAACERGAWLDVRIDTALPDRQPPRPDIRKMLVPLGPVVVFGAANFPFAYSTAGGDTACAFAAGCPVIVKAHPAHARTSELAAACIERAAMKCGMPAGIFAHLHGVSNEVGKALVEHTYTRAVGFTGSFAGGKQLFDWANQRKQPIPVFAEMSSINPVFLLPEKLETDGVSVAEQYAASITLGVGQFCTNPGLLIAVASPALDNFIGELSAAIQRTVPGTMLHTGIFKNYVERRAIALSQADVEMLAVSAQEPQYNQAAATLATVPASVFLTNPLLHQEVFGPYSLLVQCSSLDEMLQVAQALEGQLTTSVIATVAEAARHTALINAIQDICGRLILNGVPTGVEVCLSMQHGGPFPATTDSRFSAVGADGIRRFARPLAYQQWDNTLLPAALQDENPWGIWRTINDELTKEPVKRN
ncbi:MAG: aldehyde dehydrogenase (NADP(+)) [Sphingobacteriales bacterium]|nr:aldehyde dehydrogenase (NADP(+)) [Sphingobacteriales bacterium]NCT73268.1 aldehyde dehydrogenase (NADP(+)) [Chitinophagaceae bacterium]